MSSQQSQETLQYFSGKAQQWIDFSEGKTAKVNVSNQRHEVVLDLAADLPADVGFLDLGCGAGQLCIALAEKGFSKVRGVDFSPEMIAACIETAEQKKLSIDFLRGSIFDEAVWKTSYGAISAMGLIEYITFDEMRSIFAKVSENIQPGGSFYLGSRNRLFNLGSMNDYTRHEQALGSLDRLTEESIVFSASTDEQLIPSLLNLGPLPPFGNTHPKTGNIEVKTRHQYTPAELIKLLDEVGLRIQGIHGVHYHPFGSGKNLPVISQAHNSISEFVFDNARSVAALIPDSTTFIVHATR